MAKGVRWQRDELLVLLNLYEKLPFGQFDEAQPVIRELAVRMGRTPGSVAMKLCNLASLDPVILARGRTGLPGASALDRQVWAEFQSEREKLAPASEQLFRALFDAKDSEDVEVIGGVGIQVTKATATPTVTLPLKSILLKLPIMRPCLFAAEPLSSVVRRSLG